MKRIIEKRIIEHALAAMPLSPLPPQQRSPIRCPDPDHKAPCERTLPVHSLPTLVTRHGRERKGPSRSPWTRRPMRWISPQAGFHLRVMSRDARIARRSRPAHDH
jgi:hypothetical protein